jgi:hypothetical protein
MIQRLMRISLLPLPRAAMRIWQQQALDDFRQGLLLLL